VDDDAATLSLLTAYLVSDGHDVFTAGTESEAMDRLIRQGPQVVLLDLLRPRLDRTEVCRRLKETPSGAYTPVLASADAGTLGSRRRLHEAGVDDFVSKPYQRTELLLRVGAMLRMGSLSGQLQQKTVELRSAKALLLKQATTDVLTGLCNKAHFEGLLDREVAKAERRSMPLSVVVVALNGLRRFNRGHGHTAGDRLLRQVAGVVRDHGGSGCVAARYGDKRFVLLLPGVSGEEARAAERDLRRRIRDRRELGSVDLNVSSATYPEVATDRLSLLRALESGRGRRSTAVEV
jgi:two-component system cell cycle response regulator